jgi:hypothetical protein
MASDVPPPAYVARDGSVIHAGDHLRDICGLVWTAREVLPDGSLEIEMEVVFYGVQSRAVVAARCVLPPGASVLRYEPVASG